MESFCLYIKKSQSEPGYSISNNDLSISNNVFLGKLKKKERTIKIVHILSKQIEFKKLSHRNDIDNLSESN